MTHQVGDEYVVGHRIRVVKVEEIVETQTLEFGTEIQRLVGTEVSFIFKDFSSQRLTLSEDSFNCFIEETA